MLAGSRRFASDEKRGARKGFAYRLGLIVVTCFDSLLTNTLQSLRDAS